MAQIVQCSAHSCLELQQATWFLVATGFLEAVARHNQQNNLPNTKSEVSAEIHLSQLSTLRRRHSFGEEGNWEENGSFTVVTGWHLHVTLSSVLVIDTNWIAAWLPHQLARLARHGTSTSACSSSMAKVVQRSALFSSEVEQDEQATWFLVATGFLEAVARHNQQNNLPNTRFEVSAKLKLARLSTLQRRNSSLIWSLARKESVKTMILSQRPLADTRTCTLSSVLLVIDTNWIAAWTPHQLARLSTHWTSTSAYMLPACQNLFNALLILARKWNRQTDSW